MKEKKSLLKRVNRIPLFELVPAGLKQEGWENQKKYRAVVEKGRKDALAYVSKRYNLLQIRGIFNEVLEAVGEDVNGEAHYYGGRGELEVYPSAEDKEVGILVRNSVDGSTSLKVSFCTKILGKSIDITSKETESFSRIHTAKDAKVDVEAYVDMLSDVEKAWDTIIRTKMGAKTMGDEESIDITEELQLGRKFKNKIENYVNSKKFKPMTFWNLMKMALREVNRIEYKSDIHYRKKIRDISSIIIRRCVAEEL